MIASPVLWWHRSAALREPASQKPRREQINQTKQSCHTVFAWRWRADSGLSALALETLRAHLFVAFLKFFLFLAHPPPPTKSCLGRSGHSPALCTHSASRGRGPARLLFGHLHLSLTQLPAGLHTDSFVNTGRISCVTLPNPGWDLMSESEPVVINPSMSTHNNQQRAATTFHYYR